MTNLTIPRMVARKDLRRGGKGARIGNHLSSPQSPGMAAKPRAQTKNTDDPRGQFGAFLRDWIDRKHDGDESRLAAALGISDRAVRKWCEGANAPPLADLDRIAKAMGYSDWGALASAAVRFVKKQ